MSIEGQGHFFIIYFPGFVCFVLYLDKISGVRLQDHWSSGFIFIQRNKNRSTVPEKLMKVRFNMCIFFYNFPYKIKANGQENGT